MAAGHRAATRSVVEGHERAGRLTQIEMSGTGMDANTVLALGLGVTLPWRLVNQRLETGKQPHELHLEVAADRGSLFPCPVCGKPCKAHDFAEFTWRHLNFFQHHCYITAKLPRTDCAEHGVLRMTAPWAREGSRFTLLFEQAALMLVREMPVLGRFRDAACGAGTVPWQLDLDRMAEDFFHLLAAQPQPRRPLPRVLGRPHRRRPVDHGGGA